MKKLLFGLCLVSFLFQSCKDDDLQPAEFSDGDFLVFGDFFGECVGEGCIEIFYLDETQLLEDSADNYPGQTDFNTLDFSIDQTDKRDLVMDLWDEIPDELLTTTEKVIGSPDAGDWGGVYVEVSIDGQHDFWLLDNLDNNLPSEELKIFKNKVIQAIDLINN